MNEEIRQVVINQLSNINGRLCNVITDQFIWEHLNQRLRDNADIGRPGDYFNWLTQNHFCTLGARLRAMTEVSRESITLGNVLKNLAERNYIVTRQQYLGMYDKGHFPPGYPDECFDRICRRTGCREYPKERAIAFQQRLEKSMRPVRIWVDKRVAHWDRKEPNNVRLFEFRWAISVSVATYRHLARLIEACDVDFHPHALLSHNWSIPLTFSWEDRDDQPFD